MTASTTFDPRPQLAASLDQVERQIDSMKPDDLGRPTPCAEYDVRTLLAHLIAVLRKLTAVRAGDNFAEVTDPADDLDDDGRSAFRHARAELERAWTPDAALEDKYTLPYGTMTGRELLDAYTHEFTVHAWDLCRALGDGDDLDPELAVAALDWYTLNVPADDRSEGGPFGPAAAVSDDADPYTRLAAFVGRST
ncbi:TIGR03086 family protein [Brevibacterium sandarakinum]|uniref:TIGR03086 family protein n=1 Tax=Brevibacterium sandarakinum TaxID=629680 RepID=A0A1H1XFF3_BRESA|nr:TIGR03086 family metal-binding protein [Brevibacterium sandarakinum]SDT07862.1 TIGR03086 family protein [Brevibacterium sandarakinum]